MLFSFFDRLDLRGNVALPEEWRRYIFLNHAEVQQHLQQIATTLEQRRRAHEATMEWVLVARRLPHAQVPRTVALKIAALVYASRDDGNVWDVDERQAEGGGQRQRRE